MEQNVPVVAKKVWSLVRAMLFMIKKNICKRKLLLELNTIIKRGKALQNRDPPMDHYEFSCSNTPVNPISIFTTNKKHKKTSHKIKSNVNNKEHDTNHIFVDPAVIKALEMLTSAAASPAVSGFGRSPVVRQLRVTDSPFPLSNVEDDSYVDEAAEKFIMKFYNELRREC
ncbi:hypothetical protein QVD17_11059 [Tagetes erecta]|uniref:Avr9/Cf-9 rapidly elicited protein 146 n=1 Tax=Tagetes erecta TaxID=13708 RepID=A0AAD8L7J4_TARER|nr:hypothetical protein QVD17_11059 [Tagetes erecta]